MEPILTLRLITSLAVLPLLAACTTNIHAKDDTIKPSTVRLGTFSTVVIRPLAVEKSGNDEGDKLAIKRIDDGLSQCLKGVFPTSTVSADAPAAAGTLIVEPAIEDLKKVNTGERIFAGAYAGSSAVLLRTRYRDGATGTPVAEPVFYSKADAMGGAWSFGATDNAMLQRISTLACDYAKQNY